MPDQDHQLLRFYESQHRNPTNRWVHHISHLMAVAGVGLIFWWPLIGALMIVMALPMSWFGHFAFERNVPAFFDTTSRGGIDGGVRKKVAVALGGIWWTAACFARVFGVGPLAHSRRK